MKRTDYLYLLADVSNSMSGPRLGAVNDAINNIVYRFRKVLSNNEIQLKMMLMHFSKNITWSNAMPVPLDSFVFSDLQVEDRFTNIGAAFEELHQKLLKQFSVERKSDAETTIVLFTDGLPTDDYKNPQCQLNGNPVFLNANRIVFAFHNGCEDMIEDIFAEFASGADSIIYEDFVGLNKMLFEKYRQVLK